MTSPAPPILLPGFDDIERLGSGGLGDVYRARRRSTGGYVAIKVLRDWTDHSVAWQRAQRELRALVDLQGHPFVVHVEEVVEVHGVPHLVMEYAPGGSIADLQRERGGSLSVGEVTLIGEQTSSALEAAHRRGILHLDIKPQNLLIGPFGQVKVCDFGIAALTQTDQFRERTSAASYRYASPEQLDDSPNVGPPADVFALGATLVHLLTGRPLPLRAGGQAFVWSRPVELRAETGDRLEAMVQSCTAIEPTMRPPVDHVHDELSVLSNDLGDLRRRVLPLVERRAPATVTSLHTGPSATTLPPPPPPAVEAPSGPATTRRRRPWLVATAAIAIVAIAVAVGLVLFAGGEDGEQPTVAASTSVAAEVAAAPEPSDSAPVTPPGTSAPPAATVEVPRLVGRTVEQAQAVLAGLGLEAQLVEEEGAGPYGEVVRSEPSSGTELTPDDVVTLTVNRRPTQMPDVVGQTGTAAARTLESYDITVTTTEVIDSAVPNGQVLQQTPAAGASIADEAQLVVSRQPAIVYLADVEPVAHNNGYNSGQAQVNGEIYTRGVFFDASYDTPSFVEYDLARDYTRLMGRVGPRDDASSDTRLKVEIFADNVEVFEQDLGLGQSADLDLDMTGVLRLRLQVTDLVDRYADDLVVFADARLLGLPDVVPTTTEP